MSERTSGNPSYRNESSPRGLPVREAPSTQAEPHPADMSHVERVRVQGWAGWSPTAWRRGRGVV